ncbi:protein-disulfide reductase DsbD [Arhodomonas sp. AD133]|uniref:protein-disulfide reductase DsbD n=1 Tax=Arhodomonas sp. AD133 TaxID=3415009 RepID=UPI003EB7E75F
MLRRRLARISRVVPGLIAAVVLVAASANVYGQSGGLSGLVGGESDLLRPEQAFPLTVERVAPDRVVATWDVQDGYYLYRDKVGFSVSGDDNAVVRVETPPGKEKDDPYFGRVQIYETPVSASAYLEGGGPVDLVVEYQGCAEAGVCYPPQAVTVSLAGGGGASVSASPGGGAAVGAAAGVGGGLGAALASGNTAAVLTGFFLAGLVLAFTACLYPMVPILSGLIAGDSRRTGWRAFWLSLVYVESTAVAYALAGVAAGLSGAAVQAQVQGPWVLGAFAALFVVMALGMFGVFNVQLPSAWQTRLTELSHRQRGGTVIGVTVMGVLSALIVGACSGPALIAALAFISTTGDAWLGGVALFVLANGMGVPLLVIGTAAGRWLPRAGVWMNLVRQVVGVLFLGVAIYFLDRIVPAPVTLALWGLLLLGCGVFMGGLDALGHGAAHGHRLRKAGGLALVIWGAVSLVGASAGGGDVWRPLERLAAGGGATAQSVAAGEFRTVDDLDGLRAALADARSAGRPALVDVYADWCVYCVQLDEETFADPQVRARLAEAVLLRVDVTEMNTADHRLLSELDVFLPPAVMLFGPGGEERRSLRVVGFLGPGPFLARLREAWGEGRG